MKKKIYFTAAALLITILAGGQTEDEAIRRSVTLYNPYKPTLQAAAKHTLLPSADDTSTVRVKFAYDFTPGSFVPEYEVSPIKSAVLSPDPLEELRKGYVSLGFGTYLSPFLEVSISNGRSAKGSVGLFTRSYASASRIELENDARVYGGFLDNQAILYGKKYFRRSRLDMDIDFRQMTRYAYGYDPDVIGYDPDKKDIRSLYYDATARARYFTMEPDSNDINWDATVSYNIFMRESDGMQHNPSLQVRGGTNMFGLYGGVDLNYDLYLFAKGVDSKARNLLALEPYITKGNDNWRFKFGLKANADLRENYDPLLGGETKLYMHFYPDVSFTFRVIPQFLRFTAAVDGWLENNQARNTAYVNPWMMPGDTLFTLRSTDNQLRINAGISGNMNVTATYALGVSFTMFRDMLLFMNDTIGVGNYFLPVYDDGSLLKVHGEVKYPVGRQLTLSVAGNWYGYDMSGEEYAWHKPDWDGSLKAEYNLRNKIIASAAFSLTGVRHALVKAPRDIVKLPGHPNLNLGAEYRYTPDISFWLRCNNISYNRYFEWNYYPSRNFMILGGFTYSL
ncbi:MAG: hypothetical protein P1P83_11650 [Bacteroidales bacterium]|nr:hypothetical protein [Bacteroidales bacterium]MDT8374866.1 hypothetical protein [Bacteroidales bacterium]